MTETFLNADEQKITQEAASAIQAGDISRVRFLLTSYPSTFRKRSSRDDTLGVLNRILRFAGENGNLDGVKFLVEYGGDINAVENNNNREGMIQWMFKDGDRCLHVAEWLLEHGAVINQTREGGDTVSMSLINAASDGALAGVKLLLRHGASLNGITNSGLTALDFAEWKDHRAIVEYLKSIGALHASDLSESGLSQAADQENPIDALLDQDEVSPLEWSTFDDELWLHLSSRIVDPAELENYPQSVGVYLASRWVEWEVGNGGFAQAACNIPQWFEIAAIGYAALGKPKTAALIKEAVQILNDVRETLQEKGLLKDATTQMLFSHFIASGMGTLTSRILEDEWWIDEERVEYVRNHRSDFRGIK